jgi:hypothetical protein
MIGIPLSSREDVFLRFPRPAGGPYSMPVREWYCGPASGRALQDAGQGPALQFLRESGLINFPLVEVADEFGGGEDIEAFEVIGAGAAVDGDHAVHLDARLACQVPEA